MVAHPIDYHWSSYGYNAQGKDDALVTPHGLYCQLGSTPEERQKSYRQLFRRQLSADQLDELREATNKAWVLGSDKFKSKIAKLTARQVAPKAKGGNRHSRLNL